MTFFQDCIRRASPVSPVNLEQQPTCHFDFSPGSLQLKNAPDFGDPIAFNNFITGLLRASSANYGYGGYAEARPFYLTPEFSAPGPDGPRWRTVHLGLDVWGPAATPVYAPLDGRVHSSQVDPAPGSYGPTIILEHELPALGKFHTLYGHLAKVDVPRMPAGSVISRGQQIAQFGALPENGNWPPHLHFQVVIDLQGMVGDYPGVAFADEVGAMMKNCPDPSCFFNLPGS